MINVVSLDTNLMNHHLFSGLTDEQRKQMMMRSHKVALPQGTLLFHQGDKADRFYFVISGTVRLYRIAPSGHEKVVDVVREGQCFGEALMFGEQTVFPVTADALTDAVVIGFENQSFVALLRENSEACFALMARMSQRLHTQLNEIENLSLQNAMHRLVNYLLQALEGTDGSLTLDIPKRLLASQLAIQPETLSRLLKKLTNAQILEVNHSRISLIDKVKLYALATDNQPLRSG
jgi:CRP-like cAMP-binding protein